MRSRRALDRALRPLSETGVDIISRVVIVPELQATSIVVALG
ncbi:hypothetical protein [Pectobacterium parmentieri]|nr:hypothetical protein [Pectobacterium parmentieri]